MNIRAFKYLSPLVIYIGAFWSFSTSGWQVWMPLIWAWVIIPLAELFIKPLPANLSMAEEELAKKDRTYDILLYLIVILQYSLLIKFCIAMKEDAEIMTWQDIAGRIWVMGLLCGTFGINVGHELGHRVNKFEQTLAKALLLTSLYMHFFTEHNKGHHKRVATPDDPSSARYGEPVYTFYFRTIIFSYISAWHIANNEMRKKGNSIFSWQNEMIQLHVIQIVFVSLIGYFFGATILSYFVVSAIIGILMLETVNYIEHYGLARTRTASGNYERTLPQHSWNSDHVIGRIFLFELSRHSDHHYMASRKYQMLKSHENAPQLPTGYPGSMLLSLVPPIWFRVMNKKIASLAA